jgi:hypothetical protein
MVPTNLNILVINVARIGDTLLTTPVLRAIKAACPDGRLGCLAHPKRVAVLEGLEWVIRWERLHRNALAWFGGKWIMECIRDAPLDPLCARGSKGYCI